MMLSIGGSIAVYVPSTDSAGGLRAFFDGSSAGNQTVGTSINDGGWHHFVATSDGKETRTYVDGVLVSEVEEPLVLGSDHRLFIGSQAGAGDSFFKGDLDELAIYNRALSVDEIRQSCRRGDSSVCPDQREPIILTPLPNQTLPPTRAYWSWRGEKKRDGSLVYPNLTYDTGFRVDVNKVGRWFGPTPRTISTPGYFVEDPLETNSDYELVVTATDPTTSTQYQSTRSFSTDSSLTAWWRFEWTDGGGHLIDSSGNNHFGLLSPEGRGPSFVDNGGVIGTALQFDGADDYVTFESSLIPQNGPAILEGWFWFKDLASYRGKHMQLFAEVLYQHASNNFLYMNSSNDYFNWVPELNRWYHLALTYSGDSSTAKLYVDGELKNINVNQQTGPSPVPAFYGIVSDPNRPFDGLVDEVSVVNTVLSSETIKNNYCAVVPADCTE